MVTTGAGWSHGNEGQVVAAVLDAHSQLVVQARMLAAKELPESVPTRKDRHVGRGGRRLSPLSA